jgi:hypothetical protein
MHLHDHVLPLKKNLPPVNCNSAAPTRIIYVKVQLFRAMFADWYPTKLTDNLLAGAQKEALSSNAETRLKWLVRDR